MADYQLAVSVGEGGDDFVSRREGRDVHGIRAWEDLLTSFEIPITFFEAICLERCVVGRVAYHEEFRRVEDRGSLVSTNGRSCMRIWSIE